MIVNILLILAKIHQIYLIIYEATVISFYKYNVYCHCLNRLKMRVIQYISHIHTQRIKVDT